MAAQDNARPIIIKRKKIIQAAGHHGGAWKVAYADFVTAMMAFFLLMWLLNATTEQQRKGVADYFSPTIPINRVSGGGDGSFGGDSVFSEETLPQNGTGATNQRPTESNQARGESGVSADGIDEGRRESEDADFKVVEKMLLGHSGESNAAKEALKHILTRVTDEGLVIELFDLPGAVLFDNNSDKPTMLLKELTRMLVDVTGIVSNNIAVGGHTMSVPIVLENNPVWDLSTARANGMRILMRQQGMARNRVERVTGHADRKPVVRNRMALRNNRIEVILLRNNN